MRTNLAARAAVTAISLTRFAQAVDGYKAHPLRSRGRDGYSLNLLRSSGRDTHSLSDPFKHGRQPLAAANAHRLQTIAPLAPIQLAQQRSQDPYAGSAHGVSKRDP